MVKPTQLTGQVIAYQVHSILGQILWVTVYVVKHAISSLGFFFSLREFWLWQVAVHNEDLLTFLPSETVMIRCDKPNHNFNKKLLSPYYLAKLCVGFYWP